MATTIARLIEELQNHYDPNEPVIYQFITTEHVPSGISQTEFEQVADYLEDTELADRLSMKIFDYIEIAQNNLPNAVDNVAPNN
jgi:hypothetical protein